MTPGKLLLTALALCAVSWAWARQEKPVVSGEKLIYPGSEKTGLSAGTIEQLRMTTKDGFDKVVAFYEKATGQKLQVDKPGSVSLEGMDRFLIDDSKDRPVQLRVFVHTAANYLLTLVISRAKGEEQTHIVLVWSERKAK